jgi:hypothetical protein
MIDKYHRWQNVISKISMPLMTPSQEAKQQHRLARAHGDGTSGRFVGVPIDLAGRDFGVGGGAVCTRCQRFVAFGCRLRGLFLARCGNDFFQLKLDHTFAAISHRIFRWRAKANRRSEYSTEDDQRARHREFFLVSGGRRSNPCRNMP